MKRTDLTKVLLICAVLILLPAPALATVESTLNNFGTALATKILPLVAILGLVYAGFSFVTGNPNAKNHLFYAIVGVGVGFGAKSIVDFVRGLVQ